MLCDKVRGLWTPLRSRLGAVRAVHICWIEVRGMRMPCGRRAFPPRRRAHFGLLLRSRLSAMHILDTGSDV